DVSGENIFFTTRDKLTTSDTDELIDLYDARVDGGFTSESELPPRGCGEGCQPSPAAQVEPPPSSTAVDPGNVMSQSCKKGQVKKKGRCIKKSKHRKPRNRGGSK
ncbi:MAG TPA: hypothetical protein VGO24_03550, partial [Solirubrobacterales bacterium]|nr:hypothetical protein [Solirubrobacterales bacterium]